VSVVSTAVASPWRAPYLRTTAGIVALTVLFAFEALAVAAIMPDIAADLDGLRWYPIAFAAPVAASVVALAVAGPAIDRHGPGPALVAGLVIFCAGLALAGLAPTMLVFLLGRLVHGFGGGVLGVGIYVVVGQAYPEHLRAPTFAALSAAWVLPALVGPITAASVARAVGWRWVFLGVPMVAVAAWLLVRSTPSTPGEGEARDLRVGAALLAATGVLLVSIGGQRGTAAWPVLVLAGLLAIGLAGRRLLPPGSWTGRPGLPSVIGTRGLISITFAGAEVYVPLLLTLARGLTLAQAGWVLTTGAVTWSIGAWLAAHWRVLREETFRVRVGCALLATGVGGFALVAVPAVPLAVPMVAWGVAGLGMGMSISTLSVLALAQAPAGAQGRTSSALQLNDFLAQSTALAVGSVVFAGFASRNPVGGATLLVVAAALAGVLAFGPASRLRPRPSVPSG
jgi:MFS family permease